MWYQTIFVFYCYWNFLLVNNNANNFEFTCKWEVKDYKNYKLQNKNSKEEWNLKKNACEIISLLKICNILRGPQTKDVDKENLALKI